VIRLVLCCAGVRERLFEVSSFEEFVGCGLGGVRTGEHLFDCRTSGRIGRVNFCPFEIFRVIDRFHFANDFGSAEQPRTIQFERRSLIVNTNHIDDTERIFAALIAALNVPADRIARFEVNSVFVIIFIFDGPQRVTCRIEFGPEFRPKIGIERFLRKEQFLYRIQHHR